MESTEIIGQRIAAEKKSHIDAAIDISESLDNCFFHAFALYNLANELTLPSTLFSVYRHDNAQVRKLKRFFPSTESLQLFDEKLLFEKTMILGVLFRSWFVAELLKDEENREKLFTVQDPQQVVVASQSGVTFLTILTEYQRARNARNRRAELNTQELIYEGIPLFQANAGYIKRFSGNLTKDYKAIKQYWDSEGYARYCFYLAQEGVKISHEDISSVLCKLKIPYAIYSKTSITVVTENMSSTEYPEFELAIQPQAAHYHLLLSKKTRPLLLEYQSQRLRYKREREAILANKLSDKVRLCEDNPNWFLAAILPSAVTSPRSSLELLVKSVAAHVNNDSSGPTKNRSFSPHKYSIGQNVFQADSPIKRRRKTTLERVKDTDPTLQSSFTKEPHQPRRSLKPRRLSFSEATPVSSVAESPSYSFYLKIAFSLATTLFGLALFIAGFIVSNPILIGVGSALGASGFVSLCFFSYKASEKEEPADGQVISLPAK